jgi:hypothetical protein
MMRGREFSCLREEAMKAPATVGLVLSALAIATASGRAQPVTPPAFVAPTPLATLAKALSGKWQLHVRFEPSSATARAIEGSGAESWSPGPGGIGLIEQEHIPSPEGDAFLLGVIWWDGTTKQLAGMECNSHLLFTCDLKGALNDITLNWGGKRFQIDEVETHDGKRTVWHESWTDITPTSFVQTGNVTQPDGTTVRVMNIRAHRVKELQTLGGL